MIHTAARGWYAWIHFNSHPKRKTCMAFRTSDAMQDEQKRRVPRQQPLLQAAVKVHLGMALGLPQLPHHDNTLTLLPLLHRQESARNVLSNVKRQVLTRSPKCTEQDCRAVSQVAVICNAWGQIKSVCRERRQSVAPVSSTCQAACTGWRTRIAIIDRCLCVHAPRTPRQLAA